MPRGDRGTYLGFLRGREGMILGVVKGVGKGWVGREVGRGYWVLWEPGIRSV